MLLLLFASDLSETKLNSILKSKSMRRAIFLDRDGTLNKPFIKNGLPFSPSLFSEFEILPGVKESLLKLKKLNFVCLLITNQPDVSRGKIKKV